MSLPMVSTRNSLNSAVEIPKPSGIGLHLNSIVNAVQGGSVSKLNIRTTRRGNVSIVGGKISDSHLSDYSNLSSSVSESIDGNSHENHTSVGVTSPVPLSTCIVKPLDGSVALNSLEDQLTPGSKRKCTENVDDSEEFNKSSPQRKRMKSSDPVDSDGCKHCNCKRSKCLKLYCYCFAAGIYCAGPCSCQGCFNKPEYKDIVLETRQKMESRDPLAFAPRVVKRSIEQPPNSVGEDEYHFTPSSARHKRGCKCKKSMCLKKYCECYQSNVGCSDGCRCEGCQNVFGLKGEYCSMKDLFIEEDTNETTDGLIPENCERTSSGNHTPLFDTNNLTPPSPAFQFSNLGKDASKAWFPSEEYSTQTPESNFTYLASPYMISSDNNNGMISEDTQDIKILDLTTFDDESSTPNLPKCVDNLNLQSVSKKIHYYPPNTPVPQFSLTKLVWESDLSNNSTQDETPDILKDSSIPKNAVKVCSPNKKRVSPPHGWPHEFGSCSSTGLRTGRKFILKAVPSFPPLTHCIDSRSVPVQKANDPQNQGVKKLQIL